jgi:hypothetical protein
MALIACPVAGKKKSADICAAFIAGAPKDASGAVFYGVDQSNIKEWCLAKRLDTPRFAIDNSYFDAVRGQQYRVTRDALQINAMSHTTDGKRFDSLGLTINPVRNNLKGHVVIIEQSPSFMQFVGAPNWYANEVALWKCNKRLRPWSADKLKLQTSLHGDLAGAWCLTTHSSAAAITALLAGIPVVVDKMSAVAGLRLSTDNSVDDRRHAFGVLADNQFTLEEFRNGKAWQWLSKE